MAAVAPALALGFLIDDVATTVAGVLTANAEVDMTATGTTTQTIVSGSSASYTFTVQLQGNMSSPITLAATGLPNLATASFNPPILPPGSTNPITLTIATPTTIAASIRKKGDFRCH